MVGDSPVKGRAEGILWRSWDDDSFALAQAEDKPALLSISAVWCHWCHVMDDTTYSDPELALFVNENFVPIRVDNDHRPEVNARYNVGGWPTTAFLTPHGGYIAGATYLPPDQLLAMLMEVKRAYTEDKPGIYDQAAQLHRQRQEFLSRVAAGPELSHGLVDRIARRMAGAYDARNGGFGEEPKFPSAPILRLLLHLYRVSGENFYRAMLEKTLYRVMSGELYDPVEGGFFRFCFQADWTEAQHEKMLEDNINLARVFLDASVLLDNPEYQAVALRTIDYLTTVLGDPEAGGFRGSQGAHSAYFELPAAERKTATVPPPDPYCYTNWTCQAISSLLEAAWKLPRPDLARTAFHYLEGIVSRADTGSLAHAIDQSGHPSPQLPGDANLLCDWAAYLNALMDAWNCSPAAPDEYLNRAEAAAVQLERRFYDPARGGYFDTEANPAAVGYMRLREKPLPENALVVEGLLKLHHATGNGSYHRRAEAVLRAYVEANRDFGEHAASYAVAVDRFLHSPLEITVEGEPGAADTHALALAASRINYPHVIIKPVPADSGAAAAHVCVDTLCYPPVNRAEALAAAVAEALEGPGNPVGSIFERFVSF